MDKRTLPRQLTPRREIFRTMKSNGMTYAQIGESMGISRQRVQQLISPTEKEREQIIQENGRRCHKCGKSKGKLEIHHTDYLKGDTIYLCLSCHRKEHGTMEKTTVIRIHPEELEWLKARAKKHNRKINGEFAAVRELVDLLEEARGDYDVLPHPEGGKPVPVITPMKVTSHANKR